MTYNFDFFRGGAIFLEDGVEVGNVLRGNLAVFVQTSSSLLNEDVTPAAIWVSSNVKSNSQTRRYSRTYRQPIRTILSKIMLSLVVLILAIGIECLKHPMDLRLLCIQATVHIDNHSVDSSIIVHTVWVVLVFGSFPNMHRQWAVVVRTMHPLKQFSKD